MFGFEKKKEKSLTETKTEAEQALIQAAQELTEKWEEARLAGSNFKPWISWSDKEVFIGTQGALQKVSIQKDQ